MTTASSAQVNAPGSLSENTIFRVTNRSEFDAVFAAAKGGETILLADGDYGSLNIIKKDFSEAITIKAENQHEADFSSITLRDSDGYRFEGIESDWFTGHYDFKDFAIVDSKIGGTLNLRGGDGVVIHNNDIGGGVDGELQAHALRLTDVSNFQLTGNYIHEVTVDVINIAGNSHHGLIEGNLIYDVIATPGTHADLFQMFGARGYNPRDLVIRNNVAIDDISTGTQGGQGFFFTDYQGAGYQNILVEQNLISSGATNTLTIRGATENVKFLDNHVIGNAGGGAGTIRIGTDNEGLTVDGNLFKKWYIENENHGATIGDNYEYDKADIKDVIRDEDRTNWESYLPAAGSKAVFGSNYGAQDLLKKLLLASAPQSVEETIIPKTVAEHEERITMRGLMDGRHEVVEHSEALELEEGTIAFEFSMSTNYWTRTLVSKESKAMGNDFALAVSHGKLTLDLQDGETTRFITLHDNIENGRYYDFQMSFDGTQMKAWVDGEEVLAIDSGFSLAENKNDLVIGARNKGEAGGDLNLHQPFHGRLQNFEVLDKALSSEEYASHQAGEPITRTTEQAPADQKTQDLLHWILANSDSDVDTSEFALNDKGQIVDTSEEARTVHAEPTWAREETTVFNGGQGKQIVVAHDETMELEKGTIAVGFGTSLVSHHRTVFSKESKDQGNDIEVWVKAGKLNIELQDGESTKAITTDVKVSTGYDLKIDFDGAMVRAWLNGEKIGEVESGFNLAENKEALILGGGNDAASGDVKAVTAFHGRIYDVKFFEETLQEDGTLPVDVIPLSELNLVDTPWHTEEEPKSSAFFVKDESVDEHAVAYADDEEDEDEDLWA